ncbi:MAG TPA: tRNA (adenosine(37)-N6)-threonylcarbamoyltransferase complex ATPase subunit type 1 TsaE [Alphaproteobacteria bacterium]|nr:tRNA (adenosine(37)-N6)-threonylcarbamoyltransferase complex ATPase subunit type 1 TsaE [Alphaproteobacteria bacterium]
MTAVINIRQPGPAAPVERHLVLSGIAATAALGAAIAERARPGDVIALAGALGAGKTTFARYFIRATGAEEEDVPSPTFTLVQSYEGRAFTIWHFDLYRLERPEDAIELGIDDAFADGVSLIEWPERLGALLPAERLDLRLDFAESADNRRAHLIGYGGWSSRLKDMKL